MTISYNEACYFLAKNSDRRSELRAHLDRAAKKLAEREKIASALGTDDKQLVSRIQGLGFNGDSARVFDLLPLILVAWADGKIQAKERSAILAVLEQRRVDTGSDACLLVETLLEEEPSAAFMNESLSVLKALLKYAGSATVMELCLKVAEASGGLLGLGDPISKEERDLIAEIADTLGEPAQVKFKQLLGA